MIAVNKITTKYIINFEQIDLSLSEHNAVKTPEEIKSVAKIDDTKST